MVSADAADLFPDGMIMVVDGVRMAGDDLVGVGRPEVGIATDMPGPVEQRHGSVWSRIAHFGVVWQLPPQGIGCDPRVTDAKRSAARVGPDA
jgi:hypothetical protein